MSKLDGIKGKLIVSCQALPDEPLHSSFIMGRMALAAKEGGAGAIRANAKEDIIEIKKIVDLPIIGIVKKDYQDTDIYITPTMDEVDELVAVQADIIALDATKMLRPNRISLETFYGLIREKYPNQKLMADCSSVEEAIFADQLGFDYIATTLVGYTSYTKDFRIEDNDFELIQEILKQIKQPLIAEGNIDSPEKARRVLELGCYSVVVGSSITRPQMITKRYTEEIDKISRNNKQ